MALGKPLMEYLGESAEPRPSLARSIGPAENRSLAVAIGPGPLRQRPPSRLPSARASSGMPPPARTPPQRTPAIRGCGRFDSR